MQITYKMGITPPIAEIIDLYDHAGLMRPLSDMIRIKKMYANSNLIISAWDNDKLVGICRSLSDFSYCCYVSDLAVRQKYKCSGIGRKLLALTKDAAGDNSNLVLLASPAAMEYYPKIGMETVTNGFIIKRAK